MPFSQIVIVFFSDPTFGNNISHVQTQIVTISYCGRHAAISRCLWQGCIQKYVLQSVSFDPSMTTLYLENIVIDQIIDHVFDHVLFIWLSIDDNSSNHFWPNAGVTASCQFRHILPP